MTLTQKQSILDKYNTVLKDTGTSIVTTIDTFTKTSEIQYKCKCGTIFKRDGYIITKNNSYYCGGSICKESEKRKAHNSFNLEYVIKTLKELNINPIKPPSSPNNIVLKCEDCGIEYNTDIITIKRRKHKNKCSNCGRNSTVNSINIVNIKKKLFEDFLSNNNMKLLDTFTNSTELLNIECKCGNIFNSSANYMYNRINICCNKCGNIGISSSEKEILDFIKQYYNGQIQENIRILDKKEIDIYLPELKLGIEYNGIYWHSEGMVKNNYHKLKTEIAEQKGIHLLQIFENEWILKKDIIKNIILSKINKLDTIYARKCNIKEIPQKILTEFENKYHRQGSIYSKIRLGLFLDEQLVMTMSFITPRMSTKYEYELVRLCSINNINVIGGASKLLKYFETTYKPKSIVSYADRRYSNINKNVYNTLGFKLNNISEPNFFYYHKNNQLILENRKKYQKHNLINILPTFDKNLSATKNMTLNGYNRIFDSGNLVYIKHYSLA